MRFIVIVSALVFGYWYFASDSEAMKTCQQTHSAEVCYHSLSR